MLNVFIARHGQNTDNANGILNGHRNKPLTRLGIQQTHKLVEGINEAGLKFDHIYTSPLIRASKTAEIISKGIGGPKPIELSLLIERDFGVMSGIKQSRIEELCAPDIIKTESVTYFLNPNGAETFPDLLIRADKTLSYINRLHLNGNILLVTHGDIGKMLYAKYYGLNWRDTLSLFHFGNSELILLSNSSAPEDVHTVKILQANF